MLETVMERAATRGGVAMADVRTTSIEEQVMRAARSYLYGHPLAWQVRDSRNGVRAHATVPVRSRARRAVAALTARVAGLDRPKVAVEPGSCS
jgi:hypothetical protein